METSLDQLKYYLKEMFQFNNNDLDFGIYRIYNLKRKEIEHFIDGKDENCLVPTINKTLAKVSNIEKAVELVSLEAYLKKFNQENLVNDPSGNFAKIEQLIINFGDTDAEKESLLNTLKTSSKEVNITDELKDKIYNNILGFFEMYYSNGDFGYNNRSRNVYKVPYEADYDGTDTMFHWKHKGSIYIKTGNAFNAIKFKIKHLDKDFELRLETNEDSKEEEIARNNNKDTKLKHYKFNRFEEKDGITRIIFNLSDSSTTKADLFKTLFSEVFKNDENIDKYLFAKNNKDELKPVFNDLTDDYDKVNDGAVKGIGSLRVKRSTLLNKVNKNFERGSKIEIIKKGKQEVFSDETLEAIYNIDQKLNSFYIGNDSDYFIHENLEDFLNQEKERFIKNHIFSDLKSILDGKLDNTSIIIAKAFDLVASRFIEFLSTIEEFQKKLFTMKKKVVESEYCLTIDNIDEKYYSEILENKAQLKEWENLFSLKIKTINDLKEQPTLVLDTKFFKKKDGSNLFKDRILAEIENLDDKTNGLLISSENYQALKVLQEKYRGKIKSLYLDPPYNAKSSTIIYKNHFKHSSWASMMYNRLQLAKILLSNKGVQVIAIDENEQENLGQLLKELYPEHNQTCVSIVHNASGIQGDNFSYSHEMAYFTYPKGGRSIGYEVRNKEGTDTRNFRDVTGEESKRDAAANCFYPIIIKDGKIIKFGDVSDDNFHPGNINISRDNGTIEVYPVDPNSIERKWRFARQTVEEIKDELKPKFLKKRRVWDIERTKDTFNFKTVWTDSKYFANNHGTQILNNIIGKDKFSYPKSIYTVIDSVRAATFSSEKEIVLDFFAGSATTGHSIQKLNKEDENYNLKYILVEMGSYFESVTKLRNIKIMYSQNWKDSKPIDNNGSYNHIFKYLTLEQYEDILDSIENNSTKLPKNIPLKYLYQPELNQVQSTLDLSKPFSNKIKYGQPTKEGFVDLVETYNYLQGYDIKTIKTYTINKKYYKVVETLDTLVVWRDIKLKEDDSDAIIKILKMYPEILNLDINYDFNKLITEEGMQINIDSMEITVKIIHADEFNQ